MVWPIDTTMTILRRSKRSAADPASGPRRKVGKLWHTSTSVTSTFESLASCTTPRKATVANQSPM
jgi:hypothetical protein